jgi:UPF0755 protein
VLINFRKFRVEYAVLAVLAVTVVSIAYILRPKEIPIYPTERITIPEGYNIEQIDDLLFKKGIISERGSLISISAGELGGEYWFLKDTDSLEGFLFPDTYEFFLDSNPKIVAKKFLDNWKDKASNLFISKEDVFKRVILASMVEKEVPDSKDERALVAGILLKREKAGMYLQVDSTLCYAKDKLACKEVVPSDKKIDSLYNTYKNKGFPPGPISNPGLSAIKAALYPKSSEYWYFISDPETGRTVFAQTLDEHTQNIVKYLR